MDPTMTDQNWAIKYRKAIGVSAAIFPFGLIIGFAVGLEGLQGLGMVLFVIALSFLSVGLIWLFVAWVELVGWAFEPRVSRYNRWNKILGDRSQ